MKSVGMISDWLPPKRRNLAADYGSGDRDQVSRSGLRAILSAILDLPEESACGRLAATLEIQAHACNH